MDNICLKKCWITNSSHSKLALPDSGPQLNLLGRAQLPVSTPPPLTPLTAVTVVTPGQPRRVAQEVSGEREDTTITTNTPTSNFLSDFGSDSDTGFRQRDSVSIDGPLIRCSSTRSSPVAQLRFFINNRPVELNRTLENATTSYTDGTESNVVSFKILLSDFAMLDDENNQLVLDRAASKKTNSSKADQQLDTNKPVSLALTSVNTTTTITTSTTTTNTTTTTPKPGSKAPDKTHYANANVQFDDHNVSMNKGDFKVGAKMKPISADKEKKKKANRRKKKQKKKKKQKADKQSEISKKVNSYPENYDDEISNFDEYSDAIDESLDEREASNNPLLELQPLPVVGDKANIERKRSELVGLVVASEDSVKLNDEIEIEKGGKESEVKAANYDHSTEVSKGGRNKRETTNTTKSEPGFSSLGSDSEASSKLNKYQSPNNYLNGNQLNRQPNLSSSGNKDVESNQEHLRLVKQEQRVRQQTSSNSNRVSELYSNYIRIKCTSLVPAVGYEMTSELNVPLTVLVPARQISDALRQQPGGFSQQQQRFDEQQNFRLRDSEITTSRRRQQQQESGGANNDETNSKLFNGSRFAIRNGGSLQAPRAVLIDRLAQASSPEPSPSRSSNYSSSAATTFSSAPPSSSRNPKQAPSNKQASLRNTNSTNSLHEQQQRAYKKQEHKKSDKSGEYQSTST